MPCAGLEQIDSSCYFKYDNAQELLDFMDQLDSPSIYYGDSIIIYDGYVD